MKRITINELPEVVKEEVFNVLVEMALEDPKQTFDWRDISVHLSENDLPLLMKILDKVRVIKKAIEEAKENAKSEEQKKEEKEAWDEFVKNADPAGFYGNMGEPETPQQYKDKYGVWPPGYDKKR
ncbi:hypothetical protein BC749_1011434 [Flavobacterium araucananum]|uniref:Uncharacterized protein n=1 Tax=Flavobacterium araucananum TaxID=946678 RepID=A0A227NSU8_9FLAO|nr:hypothetical protein [Flavobacterium araucananum]OXG00767.1 hypothetical protein B0A64_19270 [Flavobacterium araucananum]PWK03335.1 hypothetical protein BC749_1011434 [Flavobacterium araucananum]